MFYYFPENYMWSMAVYRALMGGGHFGEVSLACEKLKEASVRVPGGDKDAWYDAWSALSHDLESFGREALENGRTITARDALFRATQYWQWAEAILDPDDARSTVAFRNHLACFKSAIGLMPGVELVEIPYDNGAYLPAYYIPARGRTNRGPAVLLHDGVDGTKEEMFLTGAALADRGVAVLCYDQPGHGESIKLRGIPARHDAEYAATKCFDVLAQRAEIDPERIGIVAESIGGYYAPRAAAFEKRLKLCVAWGAVNDYHMVWKGRFDFENGSAVRVSPKVAVATTGKHLLQIMAAKTYDEALKKLEPFNLNGVAELIDCDFLVVHGTNDRQTTLDDAKRLFEKVRSKNKEMWLYTPETGGASHVQLDRFEPCRSRIADWVAERL
jgi:alpha-beta hydrolase superfamily lysophospholipase